VPIFWLGLMGLVLFYASSAGWRAWRIDIASSNSVPVVSGVLLLDSALAGQWAALAMRWRTWPCRPRCLAIFRSPIQPHDAQLHAQGVGAGVRRGGARQGLAGVAHRLAPRAGATRRCRW